MFSLKGKTAIMTGATGGLGSSMALALAKAGASIVSIELPDDPNAGNLAKAISDAGSSLHAFYCDVGNAEQLRACFAQIWDAGAVPDILVNSAGIARRNKCEDATDAELDLLLDINVKSFYIACQEFGRRLLSLDRPGKIINIASVTAFQANKNTSIYSASKGAVVQMTKAFSNEWSSRGIQVNAICPGWMRTPMTEVYAADEAVSSYLMSRIPMGRWGDATELNAAALFLAAPGNSFTTGASVVVDGGFCGK
ncbi:hypothetical protein ASPVEDRAFT_124583 [Aspergillus versicolor CBS 583.65]|uniref:2-deoxy-D-gluconate 3-dehydrogenase n=1 Tax=Aspergillus versicolor CBS 583.65 TaxID=1036611 RepID=A0A1L9P9A1_ASPVE|nr:uncharacterized protein ASPVEDRAFT_124583 [Aspergillus versicolor CBS 583.65]OJI98065.1 hypothetical protein ASPVEDRAFT_124583 [Aspergillus versicolor CBS 583.65]